jgi:hypothetical protein
MSAGKKGTNCPSDRAYDVQGSKAACRFVVGDSGSYPVDIEQQVGLESPTQSDTEEFGRR